MTPPVNPAPRKPNGWTEAAKTVGLSVCLAFGIRTAVAQSFFIPSGSMLPTLQIDDRLMVDKLSYRFQDPQRGDIVVFSPPEAAKAACGLPENFDDVFIKRIVGLPGDRVEIRGGTTLINDQPLSEPYRAEAPRYDWGPKTVPAGSYLVLGDNRNNSCDGHAWGFVPRDRLVGKAAVRFFPFDRVSGFSH